MDPGYYILEGRKPVHVDDLMTWAAWMEKNWRKRTVRHNMHRGVRVSTVFLCLDHSFSHGPPVLYETMIFGGAHDRRQWRHHTLDQAMRFHRHALRRVQKEARASGHTARKAGLIHKRGHARGAARRVTKRLDVAIAG